MASLQPKGITNYETIYRFSPERIFTHFSRPTNDADHLSIAIVQLLLFGKVINTDIQNSKIAILDQSHDNTTREITSKLMSSGYFVLGEELMPGDDVEDVFRKGKVKMVVSFGTNSSKRLNATEKLTSSF